jgi:predicted acyl esterase
MVAYGDPLTDIKVWKKKSLYFIKASSSEAKKYPGFNPRSVETLEGLLIEYDVAVIMRDGVKMYIDIYRPANQSSSTKIPIIIAWTLVSSYLYFTDCSIVNII